MQDALIWTDAFSKFGFGDGDDTIHTETVAEYLTAFGFTVDVYRGGCHNEYITSVRGPDGADLMDGRKAGYTDPRSFMPAGIVRALDRKFGEVIPELMCFEYR
jgi:hypothetical protein